MDWERQDEVIPRSVRVALVASALLVPVAAQAGGSDVASERAVHFDISAQDLDDALREFAQETGVALIFSQDLVRAASGNRLRGKYTPRQAIRILLRGTGLRGTINANGVLIISDAGEDHQGGDADMRVDRKTVYRTGTILGAAASVAAAHTVRAQDAQPEEEPTIVVSGFRTSLAEGADIKRERVQFVDAVVADDIGKLPDNNVAESLQRVSGVQVARGIGEGSDISIRGLRQNLTLFNGRTLFGGGGRGGNGPDTLGTATYGTLAQVPSDLVARLEVTKLPGADMIEGALGGTVNIITRRPLDRAGLQGAATAALVYDELSDQTGVQLFGLVSNTFADDTFGIQLSASYSDRTIRQDGFESFAGFTSLTEDFNDNPDGISFDPNGDGVPGSRIADFRYQQIDDDRERIGLTGTIQWEPSDNVSLMYDALYTRINSDRERHWFSIVSQGDGALYEDVVLSENETLIAGTVLTPIQLNYENADASAEIFSNALWGEVAFGSLTVSGEVNLLNAKDSSDQGFVRLQTFDTANPVAFDFRTGPIPSITLPAGIDPTDEDLVQIRVFFDNNNQTETDDFSARLDFDYEVDSAFLSSFEFGGRYQKIETENVTDFFQSGVMIPLAALPNNIITHSSPDFLSDSNVSVPRSYLSFFGKVDCEDLGDLINDNLTAACAAPFDPTRSFEINEDIWAAYAKANFAFDIGSVPVEGNIGVRYVDRESESIGTLSVGGNLVSDTQVLSTDNWLPSAVFKFELTDTLVYRLGAARVLAFPNTSLINNNLNIRGVDPDGNIPIGSVPTASGGNPLLRPFLIDQLDASLEWYFDDTGVISFGGFYKDVKSFIVTESPLTQLPGIARPIPLTSSFNGEGGEIKGFEILYQHNFSFLPEPLDGLGVQATYSYIDSSTPLVDPRTGGELQLPGLSKHNINAVLIYEKGPVGLRLAYNWRDEYFDQIGTNNAPIFFDSYKDLSATARIEFTDNVNLTLEAVNLLDTELVRFNSVREALNSTTQSGRSYKATLRAKF